MITKQGYSKDPSLIPEAIVITFGIEMVKEHGGLKNFLTEFENTMSNYEQGEYWMHWCKNLPRIDIDQIYISVVGRLYAKVFNGGYKKYNPDKPAVIGYTADGREVESKKNYIILSGPLEKCPFKRRLPGFQGIRYATTLF